MQYPYDILVMKLLHNLKFSCLNLFI